ncbi:MAG TPA: SDR family oxidoreductase [Bryobacteraceae bacterium]|nr:SDR family oxidoreductase [Bryobacteraceae bacterium]
MSAVVLITGASTGFGRDAAERLARRGHRVVAAMRDVAGRNKENRLAIEQLAHSESLSLRVVELDVTDENSVQTAVASTVEQHGRIDAVVNNAGFAGVGITEAYTPEQFQQMFDVNVYGVVRVNRAVLPHMRRQKRGLLIHVSSGAGRVAVPAMGAYCASKFALEALADTYQYELKPFGIESILVEPGIYRTPIFDKAMLPADAQLVADYGETGDYAQRVFGVFQSTISAPDAPGSEEVAEAYVRLIEMEPGSRPFRTVVSAPIQQLLGPYNAAAEELRPIVAQIFNVPELADLQRSTAAPTAT